MSTVVFFIIVAILRLARAEEASLIPEGQRSLWQIFELKDRLAFGLYSLHVAFNNLLWCGSTVCANYPNLEPFPNNDTNVSAIEPQMKRTRNTSDGKRLEESCNSTNRRDTAICDVSMPNDPLVAETSTNSKLTNNNNPSEGLRIHTKNGTDSTVPPPTNSTAPPPPPPPNSTAPPPPNSTAPPPPNSTAPPPPNSTAPPPPPTTIPTTTPPPPTTTISTTTTMTPKPTSKPPSIKMDTTIPRAVQAAIPDLLRVALNPLSGATNWNLVVLAA